MFSELLPRLMYTGTTSLIGFGWSTHRFSELFGVLVGFWHVLALAVHMTGGFKARLTANTLRWAPCHEDPRSKRSPFEMAEMAARSTPLELVEGQGACNSSTMFHQKVQFGEKRMR